MNSPSNDDAIVTFLKRNRPKPPPPSGDLETRLMQQVETPIAPPSWQTKAREQWLWSAIAASFFLAIANYVLHESFRQPQLNLTQLEAFFHQNWTYVMTQKAVNSPADWLEGASDRASIADVEK